MAALGARMTSTTSARRSRAKSIVLVALSRLPADFAAALALRGVPAVKIACILGNVQALTRKGSHALVLVLSGQHCAELSGRPDGLQRQIVDETHSNARNIARHPTRARVRSRTAPRVARIAAVPRQRPPRPRSRSRHAHIAHITIRIDIASTACAK